MDKTESPHEPLRYDVFRELFKDRGVNPFEFKRLSGDRVAGYFPDLPSRKTKINITNFVKVLWG